MRFFITTIFVVLATMAINVSASPKPNDPNAPAGEQQGGPFPDEKY